MDKLMSRMPWVVLDLWVAAFNAHHLFFGTAGRWLALLYSFNFVMFMWLAWNDMRRCLRGRRWRWRSR